MSPGQYNWDMSIAKFIKIREGRILVGGARHAGRKLHNSREILFSDAV